MGQVSGREPIQSYVAAVLAVLVTAGYVGAMLFGIAVPDQYINLTNIIVGAAIGIGAAQWQAKR